MFLIECKNNGSTEDGTAVVFFDKAIALIKRFKSKKFVFRVLNIRVKMAYKLRKSKKTESCAEAVLLASLEREMSGASMNSLISVN